MLVGSVLAISFLYQSLARSLARTEGLCRGNERARIGACWLEAYRTFRGAPCQSLGTVANLGCKSSRILPSTRGLQCAEEGL